MNRKKIYFLVSIILFCLVILVRPFGFNINQSIILSSIIMVIIWWSTGAVTKSISSIIIILVFFLFSSSSARTILRFPLSANFVLIASSFFIAHGIKVSGLADRISGGFISKYGKSSFSLIVLSFVVSFILIFLIPQPFPRGIIMATLYSEFLNKQDINNKNKSVILFSVFVAITGTYMAFVNGDILLNNAALEFSGIDLTWLEWAKYMLVPTLIISILMFVGFILIFYRDIKGIRFKVDSESGSGKISSMEIKGGVITAIIILLWATESIHGIYPATVGLLGVLAMWGFGLLKIKDYVIIKPELLLFITAAFAIGGVLNEEGIAQVIFKSLLPSTNSDLILIFYSILVVMILHMMLGSAMTSMSISMPVLLASLPSSIDPVMMMFIIYITINVHYILPIHQVVIMIGEGEGYYDTSMIIKYGVFLTVLVFAAVYGVLLPYWEVLL